MPGLVALAAAPGWALPPLLHPGWELLSRPSQPRLTSLPCLPQLHVGRLMPGHTAPAAASRLGAALQTLPTQADSSPSPSILKERRSCSDRKVSVNRLGTPQLPHRTGCALTYVPGLPPVSPASCASFLFFCLFWLLSTLPHPLLRGSHAAMLLVIPLPHAVGCSFPLLGSLHERPSALLRGFHARLPARSLCLLLFSCPASQCTAAGFPRPAASTIALPSPPFAPLPVLQHECCS